MNKSVEKLNCRQSGESWCATNLEVCSNSFRFAGSTTPDILRKCATLFSIQLFNLFICEIDIVPVVGGYAREPIREQQPISISVPYKKERSKPAVTC